MGVLTDDMTRLKGEIAELHGTLEAFVNDVQDREAQRKKQAKKDTAERVGNDAQRVRQAEEDLAGRVEFVSDLVGKVAVLRKEFATDIAGAHQAWFGGTRRATAGSGTQRAAGRKSRAKAGA
jgi:hypothetical protein